LYRFGDGYNGYNQIKLAKEDILKMTFIIPWGVFAYRVISFGLCNALGTFQRFMNKYLKPYIGLLVQMILDEFCVHGSKMIHLHNFKRVFN
jgi:hypothetical protein